AIHSIPPSGSYGYISALIHPRMGYSALRRAWSDRCLPPSFRHKRMARRIFQATQPEGWHSQRSPKTMLRSYSNRLVVVRSVRQENQGKRTAGPDKTLVDL